MAEPPSNDVLAAVEPIVDTFEALGVRYRIGGSVASSALGVPRSTLDVDVACELRLIHVVDVSKRLASTYYLDEDMIRDAIERQSCCNLIHLATMLKVDLFIRRDRPFEDAAFERLVRRTLDPSPNAREFDLTTPEDIVLHKLEWFRAGGGVSERQWRDAVGVLAVQRGELDWNYLHQWARELGIADLLLTAATEAG
ncbi:MAG TPA: hypothetical protein VF403_01305 [Kofleriaceae bacterium]